MQKAFSTKEEHDAFEAVRTLTIVKESPTSTPDEVKAAENAVIEKQNLVSGLSEAEQISRLFLVDSRIWIDRKYR